MHDFQEHVEGYLELSAKTKVYFATAVSMWDANFYVKVDDDVHVNIGKLSIINASNGCIIMIFYCFLHTLSYQGLLGLH